MKWVQHKPTQGQQGASWKGYKKSVEYEKRATWRKCNIKWVQQKATKQKVQDEKKCNTEKVQLEKSQHKKSTTWADFNMKQQVKKLNTKKVQCEKSLPQEKYNTKNV